MYAILVFFIVLFFYLHVFFHLKTSDDLEIYEIDAPSKDKLEEICDLRQPVLFKFENERIFESCQRSAILDTYGAFDIKIRNVKQSAADNDINLYVPLAFSSALNVIREDSANKYIVENNSDFLEETGIVKSYKYNDAFLRPYMVSSCAYDFVFGAERTQTPFRYELNYRSYLLVTEGSIKVKLSQPKSKKYLYQQKDYENFEFISPINPWQVQSQYKADFDKIKCLDINMTRGQILYLPAYWWYSIEFGPSASVCSFKYKTYMNTIAILPQLVMKLLQTQNVKRNNVAKVKGEAATMPPAVMLSAEATAMTLSSAMLATEASAMLPSEASAMLPSAMTLSSAMLPDAMPYETTTFL